MQEQHLVFPTWVTDNGQDHFIGVLPSAAAATDVLRDLNASGHYHKICLGQLFPPPVRPDGGMSSDTLILWTAMVSKNWASFKKREIATSEVPNPE